MSVSQRVTQNRCFIYLRKGKEETEYGTFRTNLSERKLKQGV